MITSYALTSLLLDRGLPAANFWLVDSMFETMSSDWVLENWEAWLAARPADLCCWRDAGGKSIRDRPLWIAEASDCDNLALGTLAHAQVGNALYAQRNGPGRGGLAYGVIFYQAGPARSENFQVAGGHAINWYIDHELQLHFFEPGMGREVSLNPQEKSAIWFGLAV